MRLTLHSDYAVRTLIYLALKPDELVTISDVSVTYGISKNHMMKVAQELVHHGYISSERGRNGGIKLLLDPRDIKLGQVIEKMEPDFNLVACFDAGQKRCKIAGACSMQGFLREAQSAFLEVLNKYSLADAMEQRVNLQSLLSAE